MQTSDDGTKYKKINCHSHPTSPWCCSSWEDGSSVAQSTGSSLHIEALSTEHIICHQVPDQSGHTEDEGQLRFYNKTDL